MKYGVKVWKLPKIRGIISRILEVTTIALYTICGSTCLGSAYLGNFHFGNYSGYIRIVEKKMKILIVNASARPPRLAGLPAVGTGNYRYAGI